MRSPDRSHTRQACASGTAFSPQLQRGPQILGRDPPHDLGLAQQLRIVSHDARRESAGGGLAPAQSPRQPSIEQAAAQLVAGLAALRWQPMLVVAAMWPGEAEARLWQLADERLWTLAAETVARELLFIWPTLAWLTWCAAAGGVGRIGIVLP